MHGSILKLEEEPAIVSEVAMKLQFLAIVVEGLIVFEE